MPTDLDAAVAARKRQSQDGTQTLLTIVLAWVIGIMLIACLILLFL
jgi:hypothetical protein